jgi:hypothetical protein
MFEKLLTINAELLGFVKIHLISVYIFGLSLYGFGEALNNLAPYAGNASIIMGSLVLLITLATKIEDYVSKKILWYKKRKRANKLRDGSRKKV